jgi:hypothetical protein
VYADDIRNGTGEIKRAAFLAKRLLADSLRYVHAVASMPTAKHALSCFLQDLPIIMVFLFWMP